MFKALHGSIWEASGSQCTQEDVLGAQDEALGKEEEVSSTCDAALDLLHGSDSFGSCGSLGA